MLMNHGNSVDIIINQYNAVNKSYYTSAANNKYLAISRRIIFQLFIIHCTRNGKEGFLCR